MERMNSTHARRATPLSPPTDSEWRVFLQRSFTVLSVGAFLSAVVCVVAYNWEDMRVALKFALVETTILVACGVASFRGLEGRVGAVALFVGTFLVGPLLALYGQAYPTGAPLSKLLLLWGIVAALAAALTRLKNLWFLSLIVLNLAVESWPLRGVGDVFGVGGERLLMLGTFNLGTWLVALWQPRWVGEIAIPRFMAGAAATFANWAFIVDLIAHQSETLPLSFLLLLGTTGLLVWHGVKHKDLFSIVLSVACGFGFVDSLLIKTESEAVFHIMTYGNLAVMVYVLFALKGLHNRWKDDP